MPPPLKPIPCPQQRRRASSTSLSPHAGPRGPCTHCDARTGRRIQEGLTLWTAPHLGTSFPSWACEPAGKPRGGAPWKLGRERGYRFAAFRNRSRGLYLRQPFPAQTQRGTGETPDSTPSPSPKDCLPTKRTGVQGVEPGSQITARRSFRRASDRRRRTTGPAPIPPAFAKVAATGGGGAGPLAQSSRDLNASALVLPVRGRKCGASLALAQLSVAAPLGPGYLSRLLGSSFAWPPLERGDGGL